MKYPDQPGFVFDSATSEAAAVSMRVSAPALREAIATFIKARGQKGATCDECETALGLRHQTASARIRELKLAGRLDQIGKRETRSGRDADVHVTTRAP